MASLYRIDEIFDGLRIQSRLENPLALRIVVSVVPIVAVIVTAKKTFPVWPALIIGFLSVLLFLSLRYVPGEMEITSFQTKTNAYAAATPQGQTFSNASILRLEYSEDIRRNHSIREGLHAILPGEIKVCLLPYLDYQQTMEVLQAIETKFPALAKAWNLKTKFIPYDKNTSALSYDEKNN